KATGLSDREAATAIKSGIKRGKKDPRHPETRQGVAGGRASGAARGKKTMADSAAVLPFTEDTASKTGDLDDAEVSPFGPGDDLEPPEWMDDEQLASSEEQPSAEQPLRGLRHLGAVAVLGRERLLELAAKPIDYVWVDVA